MPSGFARDSKLATCEHIASGYIMSVGAPGFEPGVTCSQNRHVSRYTTLRDWLILARVYQKGLPHLSDNDVSKPVHLRAACLHIYVD